MEIVKLLPLSRANNISIMLTQFSHMRGGPDAIRGSLVSGKGLGLEHLSLLLQVCLQPPPAPNPHI